MQVSVEPLELGLARPFRIAHGTSTSRTNALLRIDRFFGEAALPPYYNCRVEDVRSYILGVDFSLVLQEGFSPDEVLDSLPPGPAPAIAAIDMALFDIWSSALGVPLYRALGISDRMPIVSSYALSIPENENAWRATLDTVGDFPSLKLKLGSGDLQYDEEIVRIARTTHSGPLGVDANAAWSVSEAVEILPKLAKFDLAYVEQPIGFEDIEDWHLLRRLLRRPGVPLIADESMHTTDDVIALAGAANGVNVKLAKCGGIRNALRVITVARALGLRVMIGCMIESSLSLTAAAHLAPLADFVDVDGTMHLRNDPFRGLDFSSGNITLPDRPGLGVVEAV